MNKKRAFTLVELLVSFLVLAIMLGLLFQMVSSIMRGWSQGKQLADNLSKARLSLELVTRDLQMGVFRRDLGSFTTPNGEVVATGNTPPTNYCFYVARTGGETRSLSLVNYRIKPASPSELGTTLERQVLPVSWTNQNITFGSPEIPAMKAIGTGKSSEVATGILAFRMYFINLSSDGIRSISPIYSNNSNLQTTAVGVALVALDEQTQKLLKTTDKLQTLTAADWQLPPDVSKGVGVVWQQRLDDFWKGAHSLPTDTRTGVRIFETVVSITTQHDE